MGPQDGLDQFEKFCGYLRLAHEEGAMSSPVASGRSFSGDVAGGCFIQPRCPVHERLAGVPGRDLRPRRHGRLPRRLTPLGFFA